MGKTAALNEVQHGVIVNGKKVHLIIYVILFIFVVASAVWNIAGIRAEQTIVEQRAKVHPAVKLYVAQNAVSKKDFDEFRKEYKQDFKDLRTFIEEKTP